MGGVGSGNWYRFELSEHYEAEMEHLAGMREWLVKLETKVG
jgi:hypothetical protein